VLPHATPLYAAGSIAYDGAARERRSPVARPITPVSDRCIELVRDNRAQVPEIPLMAILLEKTRIELMRSV